jgi:hypothetical protein
MLVALLLVYRTTTFVGEHSPVVYALTWPGLFVPGETWRFSAITRALWTRHPSVEASAFLGYATIWSFVYVWRNRHATRLPDLGFWYGLAGVFAVLALGPRLQIAGQQVPFLTLPYAWLERVVPMLGLSGVPIRMVVMVSLIGSVFVAEAFRLAVERRHAGRVALACVLLSVIVLERLPGPLPATRAETPAVVQFLRDQPGADGFFDTTVEPRSVEPGAYYQMYYQTIHEKPIAYGYTSRETTASIAHDQELHRLVLASDFRALRCRYGFKWLLSDRVIPQAQVLVIPRWWNESPARLYELDANCDAVPRW